MIAALISTMALLLPHSDADTAMSIRHLELSYVFVLVLQIGYAGYVALQRRAICNKRDEGPR